MRTAKALAELSDRGRFERLFGSILRLANPDYASLISTGINADDETVRAPLDAFTLVPGSEPPHYVLVEATTVDRSGLQRKWLSTKEGGLGDLIKAGQEAERLRQESPDARFTVVLGTNQSLSGPSGAGLTEAILVKARSLGVLHDLWEQSRLTTFLDASPDGHWLRHELLDIKTESVSRNLLEDVAVRSNDAYELELRLADFRRVVDRDLDDVIDRDLEDPGFRLHLLQGDSGAGKSVIAAGALRRRIARAGLGLHLAPETILEAKSLADAIRTCLTTHHPDLLPGAGQDALALLDGHAPLLLVVDDIGACSDPKGALERLLSWLELPMSGESSGQEAVTALCPVQPQRLGPFRAELKKSWVNIVRVPRLHEREAARAIIAATAHSSRLDLTMTEATSLANRLGRAGVLIGLLGRLANEREDEPVSPDDVVSRSIERDIEIAAASGDLLVADFRAALAALGQYMLLNRELQPEWTIVRQWFRSDRRGLAALGALAKQARLFTLTSPGDRIEFLHERIRTELLVEQMGQLLDEPDSSANQIADPYLAEITGRALLRNITRLPAVREHQPLALLEAIRLGATPRHPSFDSIVPAAKEALESAIRRKAAAQATAMLEVLVDTDSPAVLEMLDPNFPNLASWLARIRNGCVQSAVTYASKLGRFEPRTRSPEYEALLAHAIVRHREPFLAELRLMLELIRTPTQQLSGALGVAGHVGTPDLAEAIGKCWNEASGREEVFVEFLWAAIRCASEGREALSEMLDHWETLSTDENDVGESPMSRVANELTYALGRGVRPDVVRWIADEVRRRPRLRVHLTYLLEQVDDPHAVRLVVEALASRDRASRAAGGTPSWLDGSASEWRRRRDEGRPLSPPSREELRRTWQEHDADDDLRRRAFQLWSVTATGADLALARSIGEGSLLFRSALSLRARLGDRSAAGAVAEILRAGDWRWYEGAHRLWTRELEDVTRGDLERLAASAPDDYSGGRSDRASSLATLLTYLPAATALELVSSFWDGLRRCPRFILAALYLDAREARALADRAVAECPANVDLFDDVGWIWDFTVTARSWRLRRRHLQVLARHAERISPKVAFHIACTCLRIGEPVWSAKHMVPRLSDDHRRRTHPSDDELQAELDVMKDSPAHTGEAWLWTRRFRERRDPPDRAAAIIDRWLGTRPTQRQLQLAARCIAALGRRRDVDLLEPHRNPAVDRLVDDVRFAVFCARPD